MVVSRLPRKRPAPTESQRVTCPRSCRCLFLWSSLLQPGSCRFSLPVAPTTLASPATSPVAVSLCPSHAVCSWWPELWSSSHRMFSWHLFLQCFAKTVTGDSVRPVLGCRRYRGVGRQPRSWGIGTSFMLLGAHSSSNSSFPLLWRHSS